MPRSIRDTSIAIGFVQVPVSVYKAAQDEKLDLRSLCDSCGEAPHQRIVCETPSCGTELPQPEDAKAAIKAGQTLIEGPNGLPTAARSFQSWYHVPGRGYEWSKGEYVQISKVEIEEAKASAVKYDAITVSKTVDFKKVAVEHVLGEPYYLLPPEGANEATLKAYRLVTEALDSGGMALLSYLTMRDKTHRYAIVADQSRNILMAYEIRDARQLPYTAKAVAVNASERQQAEGILKGQWSDQAHIDAAPDPLLALLERKVAEVQRLPGIGETVIVPQ
jgi:non-homologous end joining protein Ku